MKVSRSQLRAFSSCGAVDSAYSRRLVRRAVARHSPRCCVQSNHAHLVRGHRRRWTLAHFPKRHRAAGIQSDPRHIFSHRPRVDRVLDPWGRVLAVTGAEALDGLPWAFRQSANSDRLACCRFARAHDQLSGSGALLLSSPQAIENPFFCFIPNGSSAADGRARYGCDGDREPGRHHRRFFTNQSGDPTWISATPRSPRHTSGAQFGQIYVPRINTILLLGVLLLVTQFRSSSALAEAYGVAVSGTMVVTTLMAMVVIWKSWSGPCGQLPR